MHYCKIMIDTIPVNNKLSFSSKEGKILTVDINTSLLSYQQRVHLTNEERSKSLLMLIDIGSSLKPFVGAISEDFLLLLIE